MTTHATTTPATTNSLRRLLTTAGLTTALALTATACGGTGVASQGGDAGKTVTVYTADGLGDWYTQRFAAFEKKYGMKVQTVEAGSGEVVARAAKEKARAQADVLVTLPPFIQRAARDGLLTPYKVPGSEKVQGTDPEGRYVPVVNNYLNFIHNPSSAKPAPRTYEDLLDPRFKGKLQYSTPGQAGDGTAVLIQLQHLLGKDGALDYLKKLQANNVGPSSSTGKLQPKVSKGELHVANGDLQMNLASIENEGAGFEVFFPADAKGKRSTFAIPYTMGLVNGAPNAEGGKKLMAYLLSQEAQATVTEEAYGLPARSDVKAGGATRAKIDKLLAGVEVWSPDWQQLLTELDADIAAYNRAVGS